MEPSIIKFAHKIFATLQKFISNLSGISTSHHTWLAKNAKWLITLQILCFFIQNYIFYQGTFVYKFPHQNNWVLSITLVGLGGSKYTFLVNFCFLLQYDIWFFYPQFIQKFMWMVYSLVVRAHGLEYGGRELESRSLHLKSETKLREERGLSGCRRGLRPYRWPQALLSLKPSKTNKQTKISLFYPNFAACLCPG